MSRSPGAAHPVRATPVRAAIALALAVGAAGLAAPLRAAAQGAGADADRAAALPRWEAGVAAGVAHLPDYPGADRSRTRAIALPYLVYRGPVWRIDEQGLRGRFVDTPDWEFALTATGAFDARDNDRRVGMPPLDYLFGIGPQWIYKGWQRRAAGPALHLKLRALGSTDFSRIDGRGFSASAEARWRIPDVAGTGWALTLSVEPTWASRDAQATFYEVTPAQALPGRPAWRARAGYLGTDVGATLGGRAAPTLSWFVAARWSSLHGAANVGSPLLVERSQPGLGFGLVWTPWRSASRAGD